MVKNLDFSDGEKLIVGMLIDISRRLKGDEGQLDVSFIDKALCEGHHWALARKLGFFEESDDPKVVEEVMDVLEMWARLEDSYPNQLQFPGFDGNNESGHLSIARFLIEDMDEWPQFKGRDLNSHRSTIHQHRALLPKTNWGKKQLSPQEISDISSMFP